MTITFARYALGLSILGSSMALIGGCNRNDTTATDRAATNATNDTLRTTEQGAQAAGAQVNMAGNNRQAIVSLANARCARESRCNNIGQDKKYATQQDCISKLSADKYDDLNAEECKGGIDQKELSECMEEVRNEDCNNPLDTIGRLAACRSSDLCKALPR